MPSLKVSHTMLAEALAGIVKEQSAGMADLDVTEIRACIRGDYFEIEGLEIQLEPKRQASEPKSQFTPPAGVGKIRLATVNGEQA